MWAQNHTNGPSKQIGDKFKGIAAPNFYVAATKFSKVDD